MNTFFRKLEYYTDRSIAYAIIALFFVITVELFFHDFAHHYHGWILAIDWSVLAIFVTDVCFKYYRSKTIPDFFKHHWLDVIAVFPAFLFVRVLEEFILIANLDQVIYAGQEAVEIGEKTGSKASRLHYFARFLRPLSKIPRFFKAFTFFDRPHHL